MVDQRGLNRSRICLTKLLLILKKFICGNVRACGEIYQYFDAVADMFFMINFFNPYAY